MKAEKAYRAPSLRPLVGEARKPEGAWFLTSKHALHLAKSEGGERMILSKAADCFILFGLGWCLIPWKFTAVDLRRRLEAVQELLFQPGSILKTSEILV